MIQTIYNKEQTERLSNPLPVYVYDVHNRPDVNGRKINIQPHWHGEFEVILNFCHGTFSIDGESFLVKPNDIIIIPSEKLHSCLCEDIGEMFVITLNPIFFDFKLPDRSQQSYIIPFLNNTLDFINIIRYDDPNYPQVCSAIQLILSSIRTQQPSVLIKSASFNLLAILISYFSSKKKSKPIENDLIELLKKSLDFICSNFINPLTLDEIAFNAGLSKFCYLRYFKKMFNRTPTDYIIALRLQCAYDLILRNETITSACFNSGFNNLSYFIRQFKAVYNQTPYKIKKLSNIR